jgi:hypothetical protein
MKNYEDLKAKLDEVHQWPDTYLFKFVVPENKKGELLDLVPSGVIQERWSKNQKYVSISLSTVMENSDDVIALYQKAAQIEGIVSL